LSEKSAQAYQKSVAIFVSHTIESSRHAVYTCSNRAASNRLRAISI
jgi:hypothetical protein